MINYKNIEQKTEEWHLLRYGKIGGTSSGGLFKGTNTLLRNLVADNIEEYEPTEGFTSVEMDHGNENEPFAREYLSTYVGVEFLESGWLQSEESEIMGISPDGITECETIACEIKCFAKSKHTDVLMANETPKEYLAQILQYFTVNPKLEKLYFIAFRSESIKHYIELFTRESIIDIGWTKTVSVEVMGKKGVPIKPKLVKKADLKSIDEWTKISMQRAKKLEVDLENELNKLKF